MRSLTILRRCAAAALVLFAVMSVHSVAHAQPGYYPPPPPPRGYARPYRAYPAYPGYPPSSRYYYPPAPRYYGPQRDYLYRPISLGLGLGVGGLTMSDSCCRQQEGGLSYTARLGFGIARQWGLFVGVEGTGVDHASHAASQTGYLAGVQFFPIDRLYLRLGAGLAVASFQDAPSLRVHQVAGALSGAVGYEFLQGRSSALALEASATGARYSSDEVWSNFGLNLVVSFF
jgi:hypothetical protein